MAMVKVTKKEQFANISAILREGGHEDLALVMEHEIELLAKKNGTKHETAKQKANKGIKDEILEVMVAGEKYTATQIHKMLATAHPDAEEYTPQKTISLLTQMRTDGVINREVIKQVSYFSLPEAEAEEAEE